MEQVCQVLLRRRLTHIFVAKFVIPVHPQVRHSGRPPVSSSAKGPMGRALECPVIVRNIVSSFRGETALTLPKLIVTTIAPSLPETVKMPESEAPLGAGEALGVRPT
jgi:hypothetical protein